MKKLIIVLALLSFNIVRAENSYPHEVLLQCTTQMQTLGFSKRVANEACSVSAGPECSLLQSHVIQRVFPHCIGDLIYLRAASPEQALYFCNVVAPRGTHCIPQQYITARENFVACVSQGSSLVECSNPPMIKY